MTPSASHHPDARYLRSYSQGTLSSGIAVAVAAHVELCRACRDQVDRLEAGLANEWVAEPAVPPMGASAGDLIDRITSQPQIEPGHAPGGAGARPVELHLHERSVRLPRVLSRIAEQGVLWRKLAGGINSAALGIDRGAQCDFMYMKPGSQAPRHRHQGVEITLVLNGSFRDELGEYKPGDFVVRRGSDTHAPRSEDGCLCYSVLDSPLAFTSRLGRLLNPFQRYLFNRQIRRAI